MAKKSIADLADMIDNAMDKRRARAQALCLYYAGKALKEFRSMQAEKKFWDNKTFTAYNSVFSSTIKGEGDNIGFRLHHGVEYGYYLELANDGKNAALLSVLEYVQPDFFEDLKRIYAG